MGATPPSARITQPSLSVSMSKAMGAGVAGSSPSGSRGASGQSGADTDVCRREESRARRNASMRRTIAPMPSSGWCCHAARVSAGGLGASIAAGRVGGISAISANAGAAEALACVSALSATKAAGAAIWAGTTGCGAITSRVGPSAGTADGDAAAGRAMAPPPRRANVTRGASARSRLCHSNAQHVG